MTDNLRDGRYWLAGRVSAGVVHDLNNPLAYVLANLDYVRGSLRAPELPENEQRECIDALSESVTGADEMRQVISALHVLSTHAPAAPCQLSLQDLLGKALRLLRYEIMRIADLAERVEGETSVVASESVALSVICASALELLTEYEASGEERPALEVATEAASDGTCCIKLLLQDALPVEGEAERWPSWMSEWLDEACESQSIELRDATDDASVTRVIVFHGSVDV